VRVRAWPRTEVVIGRGGDPAAEVRSDAVRAAGIPLRRRRGGGCAVVLDPGNAVLSLAWPLPGVGGITSAFAAVSAWVVEGLADLGLPGVAQVGVSDLVLDDRKLGGSCIYRSRGLLHYTTTLLLDPDLDGVDRYLPHPPREPDYRRGRAHREFMGSVAGVLGQAALGEFRAGLARRFGPEALESLADRLSGI